MWAGGVPGVLHVPITKSHDNRWITKHRSLEGASVCSGFQIQFLKMPILADFRPIFSVFREWLRVSRGGVLCCWSDNLVFRSVEDIGDIWVCKCNTF